MAKAPDRSGRVFPVRRTMVRWSRCYRQDRCATARTVGTDHLLLFPTSKLVVTLRNVEKIFFNWQRSEDSKESAKCKTSIYRPGKRSPDWLKIKSRPQQEFVVCGFTGGKGSRKHFGALLLGAYRDGKLRYFGHGGVPGSLRKDWQKQSID
jgi:hypothetical protein